MESTSPTVEQDRTISRRATLAKGATAGVLAWATPVVLSSKASADVTCSPDCIPALPTPALQYFRTPTDRLFFYVTGISSTFCPCSLQSTDDAAPTLNYSAVSIIQGNSQCSVQNTYDLVNDSFTINNVSRPGFYLRLPNSTTYYTGSGQNECLRAGGDGTLSLTVSCVDSSGDAVVFTCTTDFEFIYSRVNQGAGGTVPVTVDNNGFGCGLTTNPCVG